MLLWFGHSFSIFQCHLTLDVAHWLKRWALLTSICPVLSSSLSPTCCCPSYHSSLCSLKVRVEISSLPLPLSPMCTAPCPLCCIFLLSSLFIIQFLFIYFFFFLWDSGVSLSRGAMLVYPRGGCVNTMWHLFAPLLVCWMSPKAGLEPLFGGTGALLFSQSNVAQRNFAWAGGSGCHCFDSSWCFFSCQVCSIISAIYLIYGAHAVCFCTTVCF
jgi:hypothetical protein